MGCQCMFYTMFPLVRQRKFSISFLTDHVIQEDQITHILNANKITHILNANWSRYTACIK